MIRIKQTFTLFQRKDMCPKNSASGLIENKLLSEIKIVQFCCYIILYETIRNLSLGLNMSK